MALGWQIILRAQDNRVLSPTLASRRAWSRIIAQGALGSPLLAHGLADTHGHLLVVASRPEAGRLARRLAHRLHLALQPGVPWEPARLSPIVDQRHLQHAFFYVLGQQEHHGLDLDPWQEGSALPDLLGLRPAGAWMAANVRAHLPRVQREELLARLGADPWQAGPRFLPLLAAAAAAAVAVEPLTGASRDERLARIAAVHLAREVQPQLLAPVLGLGTRQLRRLANDVPTPAMLRAVEGWWNLLSGSQPTHSRLYKISACG